MSKKTSNTLIAIASAAMAIVGLLFLMIFIFGETKDYWALINAIADISLANLFNLIRIQRSSRDVEKVDESLCEQRYE